MATYNTTGINTYIGPESAMPGQNLNTGRTINYQDSNLKPDAYFDKMLLKMLRQLEFHYMKYATEKMLPRNFADTINWRRFIKLAPNIDPLQEARTPEGRLIRGTALTATIAQYGDVMYFSDLVDVMQLDDVKREYTVELGYLAKETLDLIVRNTLVAEGSAFFANDATGLDDFTTAATNGIPNFGVRVDDIRKITIGMKRAHLAGSRKANGKYLALVSPEIMYDLFDDNRMQTYMSFGQTNAPFSDGLAVEMFGIRFEEVLNAPVLELQFNAGTEQSPDLVDFEAHDILIIGEEGYAVTKLEGAGVKIITKGLGSAGVEDPLDQRQSIGWKITGFGAKVLNQEAVVNYWVVPSFYAGAEWAEAELAEVATAEDNITANLWPKNKLLVYALAYLQTEGIEEGEGANKFLFVDELPELTGLTTNQHFLVTGTGELFKATGATTVEAVEAAQFTKYKD